MLASFIIIQDKLVIGNYHCSLPGEWDLLASFIIIEVKLVIGNIYCYYYISLSEEYSVAETVRGRTLRY